MFDVFEVRRVGWYMTKHRIIFLDLPAGQRPLSSPHDDFGINIQRVPLSSVELHLHTAEVLQVRDLADGSGWGSVPTMF